MNHSTNASTARNTARNATRSTKRNMPRDTTRDTTRATTRDTPRGTTHDVLGNPTGVPTHSIARAVGSTATWLLIAVGVALMANVGLGGCSSSTNGDATFACAFGELSGTWRVHYEETNGNCGTIADETVVLGAAPDPAAGSCTRAADVISQDKCRADEDFTCPTGDNRGTQHWIGTLHHTAADRVSGSLTVQVNHPSLGVCRSTYDVIWTRQ